MTITERLLKLDPKFSRHNEGAWDKPFNKNKEGFSSFNDAGIECETGEFLYSLVRLLKPTHILETGTHWGVGASYMGLALQDNNSGQLDTIEFSPENHHEAMLRMMRLKMLSEVTCHLGDVAKFKPNKQYDLILLDTEPNIRFGELIQFFPNLNPGGFLFIHDLHRGMSQGNINTDWPDKPSWPFGDLPDTIKTWIKEKKLMKFHFTTPRGLVGFYKPHPDDFEL